MIKKTVHLRSLTIEGEIDTSTHKANNYSELMYKISLHLAERVVHKVLWIEDKKEITHYTLMMKGMITMHELLYIGIGCTIQDLREKTKDEALLNAGYKKTTDSLCFEEAEPHFKTPLHTPDYGRCVSGEIEKIKSGKYIENVKRRRKNNHFNNHKRNNNKKKTDDGTVTKKALEELKTKQDFKCYHCGCELDFDGRNKVHLDHYIPLARGGTHTIGNLVWSCKHCNLSKNATMPTTLLLL